MTNDEERLPVVMATNPREKLLAAAVHLLGRLDVVGPLHALQVGDKPAREAAPVAFAQQGCLDDRLTVRFGNDAACVYAASQVARDEGVDGFVGHAARHLVGHAYAVVIEAPVGLSLQRLVDVVDSLTMPH